jgi:hypothetical protein
MSTTWLWLSMMPGTTVRPRRSITRVPARGGGALSTAEKRPLRIDTLRAIVFFPSIVWILPFTKTRSSAVALCAAADFGKTRPIAAPIAAAAPRPSSPRRVSPENSSIMADIIPQTTSIGERIRRGGAGSWPVL